MCCLGKKIPCLSCFHDYLTPERKHALLTRFGRWYWNSSLQNRHSRELWYVTYTRIYYAKRTFCCSFNDSLEIPSVNPRFVKEIRAFLGPFSLLLLTLSFFLQLSALHWVKIPRSEFTKWCGQDWWLSYRHCGSSQCIWVGGERDHREEESICFCSSCYN